MFIIFLILVNVILFFFSIFKYIELIAYLKRYHLKTWQNLGSPGLIKDNTISNQLTLWRFIIKKEYLELNDKNLLNIANNLRISTGIYIASFSLLIIILFYLFSV